jgi:hypothetical protein
MFAENSPAFFGFTQPQISPEPTGQTVQGRTRGWICRLGRRSAFYRGFHARNQAFGQLGVFRGGAFQKPIRGT